MSTQIQRRRGTTAEHSTFTGVEGELTVDTTKDTAVVHDGTTVGGHPLQKQYPPLGSAAAPTYTFTGDPNTGIYSPGADQVAVATNGTGRLFVDASGRILVGANSTSGASTFYDDIVVTNTTAGTGTGITLVANATNGFNAVDFGDTDAVGRGRITYSHADDSLRIDTAGTERLRITSAGLLGIGTSVPESRLHATKASASYIPVATFDSQAGTAKLRVDDVSNSASTTRLFITHNFSRPGGVFTADNASVGVSAIKFDNGSIALSTDAAGDTDPADRLFIDSSGRVGIGTTTFAATSKLQVFSDAGGRSVFRHASGDGGVTLAGTGASSSSSLIFGNTWDTENGANFVEEYRLSFDGSTDSLAFKYNNNVAEAMRLDSSGRLLVGTSSARTNFSLLGGGVHDGLAQYETTTEPLVLSLCRNGGGNPGFLSLSATGGTSIGSTTPVSQDNGLGGIVFSGMNGLGTFSTAAVISAEVDAAITASTSEMPGRLSFSTTASGSASPTERMRITQAGSTIFYNSGFVYPVTDNATTLGGGAGFRWSAVWAANGTIQTSDQRAKVDIANATLGSDFIKALRPVSYKWVEGGKRDTGERDENGNYIYEAVPGTRTHWGFIAQEVKQAVDVAGVDFGGWVLTDKDDPDSQQSLRYDQFIAPLTKALQEAIGRIETLEAEVAALKAQ